VLVKPELCTCLKRQHRVRNVVMSDQFILNDASVRLLLSHKEFICRVK